jgi:DNA-binding NtrC family response regulator
MSSLGQAKILRAVECKEVHRLGGRDRLVLDVRWIASTNRDLERGLAEQRFRADLFYRLNVARVHLPPLRDRIEDLPSLLDRFIREFNVRFGLSVEGFTDEALRRLLQYRWPGNVREVRNLVEATFVGLPPRRISCVDLPPHFRDRLVAVQGGPEEERLRLLSALFSANWNKSQAARALRWSRMTLYRKMRRYQVSPRAPIGEARPEHAVPGL